MNLIGLIAFAKANLGVIQFAGFTAAGLVTLVATIYLPHAEARAMMALIYGAIAACTGKTYLP